MLQSRIPQNAQAFINILVKMTSRDRNILIERFHKNKSMHEVAKQLKLTKPRIQQIEDQWIKKIDQTFEFINM
jgi:DNA-directed RNA polymerase specialized sigma subunit